MSIFSMDFWIGAVSASIAWKIYQIWFLKRRMFIQSLRSTAKMDWKQLEKPKKRNLQWVWCSTGAKPGMRT